MSVEFIKYRPEKLRWEGWEPDIYAICAFAPHEFGQEMLILKDGRDDALYQKATTIGIDKKEAD